MLPGLEMLIEQCAPNVAPTTMAAIVKTESGGNPLAININGDRKLVRPARSRAEATGWATWLVAHGYSVDLGLTQVNARHLPRLHANVGQMFDPCDNLKAGARILSENYAGASQRYGSGQQALRAAISAYNTGNYRAGFDNGYVAKVDAAAGIRPPLTTQARPGAGRGRPEPGSPASPIVVWVKR